MLSELPVAAFVDTVASDAPAPGGGSAAALAGSVGAALTAMVAALTQGRKKYAAYAERADAVRTEADILRRQLTDVMDRDTLAFRLVSDAFAMPRETDEQKAARSAAIQAGLKECTRTPLEMMELTGRAVDLASSLLDGFNDTAASDLGVAFLSLAAGLQGAWLNVLINVNSLKDADFAAAARERGQQILDRSLPLAEAGYERILTMNRG